MELIEYQNVDIFINSFHSFICSASNMFKNTIKTYCKVSWTTRQCTCCCPW